MHKIAAILAACLVQYFILYIIIIILIYNNVGGAGSVRGVRGVLPTFEVIVMYGCFDEVSMVNMQGSLQNTRKMQFFVLFRFYGVYRLKTGV